MFALKLKMLQWSLKKICKINSGWIAWTFIASDFAGFSKNDAVAVAEEEMEDVEEINTEGKLSCFASIRKKPVLYDSFLSIQCG